jgi:sigma-B regulation protein RsbU (phosphoserine phosphatase)
MLDPILRHVPMFSRLPAASLEALSSSVGRRLLRAGETLFHQGEPGAECFVIVEGALEVFTFVDGAELRLDVYSAGQLIGEMAMLDRSPRSATVRAVADADLLVLGEEAFKTLLASSPDLAMSMLRVGTTRMRNTNQRMIADLERKNAELQRAYDQLKAAQTELIRLSRFEEELAVARRIQESFLPRTLPTPAGWQIAASSRGAQAVGGDFYDCIELADQRLGIVVADACGKGVTAALFVALTRSLLRAASLAPWVFQGRAELDAESVLAGALWLVNDYICREHAASNMFITLFYAVLDTATGALAYVNAGHNPPLLVSAGGARIAETELGTMPIGILAKQSYEVTRAAIGPGERLVAFSDGITEALNGAGEMFGDAQLHATIAAGAGLDSAALVERIITEVDEFAGDAPQSDDLTLLVVTRAS